MLDRIKNILQAELNDYIEKFRGQSSAFDDPEIEEMLRKFQQESNQQQKQRESNKQTYQQPQKPSKEQGYRQVLEVGPHASFEEIKKSYRKLMKVYHPDLFHNDPEKFKMAQEVSSQLNEAYSYFEEQQAKK